MSVPPRWHPIQWPSSFSNGRRVSAEDLNTASGATQFLLGGGPNAASNAPRFEVYGNCQVPSTNTTGFEVHNVTKGITNLVVATDTAGGFNNTTGGYTFPPGSTGFWYISLSVTGNNTGNTSNDQGVWNVGFSWSGAVFGGNSGLLSKSVCNSMDRAAVTYPSTDYDNGAVAAGIIYVVGGTVNGFTATQGVQTATWSSNPWNVQFSGIWLSA